MKRSGDINLNKRGGSWIKFLIGFLVLVGFIAILNFFSPGIKNTFYSVSYPVQKTFWTAGESCSGFLTSFANAGSLNKQNENLKNQVQELQAKVVSLQSVVGGNQEQSQVSLACQDSSFKLLMAGVIGLDDQDILSINKGLADGISENMPVINQQGALFGRVVKVYNNFSKVMLISNKNSVISVKVQQDQQQNGSGDVVVSPEIDGVIKGTGKFGAYLDLVPVDDTIKQGDLLVTSALEGIFPKDLLVGTITQVEKNDQKPHQQAQIQPFVNTSTDNLFVVLNYKQK